MPWHLAQINVARLQAPQGDPRMDEFFSELDRVNAIADETDGFVWRLQSEDAPGATGFRAAIDPLFIVNMSVWEDAESLFQFVYRSAHTPVMARRKEWLQKVEGVFQALWWIEAGETPTINDGLSRLWHLEHFGPSPLAFTFKARFPAPDEIGAIVDMQPDPWCEGRA